MAITEINTKISPTLHPGNIEAIEGYGADTSGYVVQALGRLKQRIKD